MWGCCSVIFLWTPFFFFFKGNYCFCQIVVNWKLTVFDKSSSCCVCDWCSGSSGGDWADIWTGTDVAACGVGLRHNQPSLPAGQDLPRPHHCVRQDFITKGTAPLLLCICVQVCWCVRALPVVKYSCPFGRVHWIRQCKKWFPVHSPIGQVQQTPVSLTWSEGMLKQCVLLLFDDNSNRWDIVIFSW